MATVTQDAEAAPPARQGYRVGARATRRPRIERGRRRVTQTKAGHARYPQPSGMPLGWTCRCPIRSSPPRPRLAAG